MGRQQRLVVRHSPLMINSQYQSAIASPATLENSLILWGL